MAINNTGRLRKLLNRGFNVNNSRIRRIPPNSISIDEVSLWIASVQSFGGTVSASTEAAVRIFASSISSFRHKFYRLNLICGNQLAASTVPLYLGTSYSGVLGNTRDIPTGFASTDFVETGLQGGLDPDYLRYYISGFTPTTKYLSSGFIPDTMADNNFLTVGACLTENSLVGATTINTPFQDAWPLIYADNTTTLKGYYGGFGAGDFPQATVDYSNGLIILERTSTATGATQLIRNNVVIKSTTSTATTTRSLAAYKLLPGGITGINGYFISKTLTTDEKTTLYNAFVTFNTTLNRWNLNKNKYVIVGDSQATIYGEATTTWNKVLRLSHWTEGGAKEGKFVSIAHSNWQLGTIGSSNNCTGNLTYVKAQKPDGVFFTKSICFFAIGINDIKAGQDGATLQASASSYCSALRALNFKVVVLNLPQCKETGFDAAKETQRLAYNSAWEIDSNRDDLIDLDGLLGDPNGAGSANFQTDKLHISDVGHGLVAGQINTQIDPTTI